MVPAINAVYAVPDQLLCPVCSGELQRMGTDEAPVVSYAHPPYIEGVTKEHCEYEEHVFDVHMPLIPARVSKPAA